MTEFLFLMQRYFSTYENLLQSPYKKEIIQEVRLWQKKIFMKIPESPDIPILAFRKRWIFFLFLRWSSISAAEMEPASRYHHYSLGVQRPARRLGTKRFCLGRSCSQSGPLPAADHTGKIPLCLECTCQNYSKEWTVGLSEHKNHADPHEISHDSRICRDHIPLCPGKKSEQSTYGPVSDLPFRLHDLFHHKKYQKVAVKTARLYPSSFTVYFVFSLFNGVLVHG